MQFYNKTDIRLSSTTVSKKNDFRSSTVQFRTVFRVQTTRRVQQHGSKNKKTQTCKRHSACFAAPLLSVLLLVVVYRLYHLLPFAVVGIVSYRIVSYSWKLQARIPYTVTKQESHHGLRRRQQQQPRPRPRGGRGESTSTTFLWYSLLV